MDYRVVLSPSARADLRDIIRYISLDDPQRALQFGQFLISRTRLLIEAPELARIVPEFETARIREIVVRAYRVIYRVDSSTRLIEIFVFGMLLVELRNRFLH